METQEENKTSSTPSIHPELREKLKEGKIEKVKMTIQELRALIKNHLFKKKRNNQ
jgi:hypothetical protein